MQLWKQTWKNFEQLLIHCLTLNKTDRDGINLISMNLLTLVLLYLFLNGCLKKEQVI